MGMNPNTGNNPMWNAARIVNLEEQHIQNQKNKEISHKKRIFAYITMAVLVFLLVGIILLFILL